MIIKFNEVVPSDSVIICGDYEKIEIALFNILSNSFKYTPEKGIITVELFANESEVQICVKDTGFGIKETELDTIFEKFRQADKGRALKKGFGIGLYVARHFINKHQGSINCSSIFGKGSIFTISIPKDKSHFGDDTEIYTNLKVPEIIEGQFKDIVLEEMIETENSAKLLENINAPVEIMSNKKSIIIVDDNVEIKNYLVSLFNENYIVNSAEDGTAGLKLIRKIMPDLVLSDITMEGLNGIELCKAIKENDDLSHIPVVLLTATKDQETQLLGLTEGADDYITKPFDDELLIARVEVILRNRSQLRRYFLDSITLRENSNKVPEEYREFLDKCIEIIENNLTNKNFTLKFFSNQMGMSHSTLYKKIKNISG